MRGPPRSVGAFQPSSKGGRRGPAERGGQGWCSWGRPRSGPRVDDPHLAGRLCARLSAGHLGQAIGRWMSSLTSPLIPEDRRARFG